MIVVCPDCGSDQTYYSARFLAWRCESCDKKFQIDQAPKRASGSRALREVKPKLVLQAGERDNQGNLLVLREVIGGITYDIWEMKSGKCLVGIPRTDNSGSILGRYVNRDEAMVKIEEMRAEVEKKSKLEEE